MLSFQIPGLSVCMTTAMTSRWSLLAALTSTCWDGICVARLHSDAAGESIQQPVMISQADRAMLSAIQS